METSIWIHMGQHQIAQKLDNTKSDQNLRSPGPKKDGQREGGRKLVGVWGMVTRTKV